jgi:DNA mismatch repair protein MutS2
MAFDMEALAPTYRLETGLPGRSYAFEIAQRVGVHLSILRRARRKMGRKQLSAEDLLRQLEKKSQEMERLVQEEKAKDARLARLVDKNERLQKELSSNKKRLMEEAKLEAKRLIKDANKKIEATIREIRESQADKERTKQLRKELAAMAPDIEEKPLPEKPRKKKPAKEKDVVLEGPPQVGDWAKLRQAQTKGELVEIQGNRGVLVSGGLRLTVKLKDLERIQAPKKEQAGGVRLKVSKRSTARIDLDVMGQRAEEALVNVQRHVDAALMGGLPMVRILHGKGSGVLRDAIRGFLKDIPQARKITDAPVEMGGDGWTVVSFE